MIKFYTVDCVFFFLFFSLSIFPCFPSPSLRFIIPSQQQCLLCNFQPPLLRSIHDRLIYMLHTCDTLLLSISKHFAAIISPGISVLFLDVFFQPIFHCKCLITCHIHSLILFHRVSSSCDFLNFIFIIYVMFFFNVLCHLVAH